MQTMYTVTVVAPNGQIFEHTLDNSDSRYAYLRKIRLNGHYKVISCSTITIK